MPEQHPGKARIIYDEPTLSPDDGSVHYHSLMQSGRNTTNNKNSSSSKNELIGSPDELLRVFQNDVVTHLNDDETEDINSSSISSNEQGLKNKYILLAQWSCILGYCEAISTHSTTPRYTLFPLPITQLQALVTNDFLPLLDNARMSVTNTTNNVNKDAAIEKETLHRRTVRAIANAIWKKAQKNKKSSNNSNRDELHANSLYTCLFGNIDNKSLDCFGITLLVVIGMNILGFTNSTLTLSEDHAYESHQLFNNDNDVNSRLECGSRSASSMEYCHRATCEVAISGTTKDIQTKRGQEISCTFAESKTKNGTSVDNSWLYMCKNPILCNNPCMILMAMIANMNCDIDKQKPITIDSSSTKSLLVSQSLYLLKRDMLWIMYDHASDNCIMRFPFALMELGECEEHVGSVRGMEWVDAFSEKKEEVVVQSKNSSSCTVTTKSTTMMILRNEKLFLDAIQISKSMYDDGQIYPYLYCAHYHRDAGRRECESDNEEYRLVESLRLYSEAARVASAYPYDTKDCMQLMKHFTTVSSLILVDILLASTNASTATTSTQNKNAARQWQRQDNAIAAATWLLGYFDFLLLWEEREENAFIEVLNIQHKSFFGKLFQHFVMDVRLAAMSIIHQFHEEENDDDVHMNKPVMDVITVDKLLYFKHPRSKRLSKDSVLIAALLKEKVVICELEMAIPSSNEDQRSSRRSKKACLSLS